MDEQKLIAINSTINIGDVIFTLLSLGFVVLIVIVVIWLVSSNKKRKHQLTTIENKIDALSEKVNKHND